MKKLLFILSLLSFCCSSMLKNSVDKTNSSQNLQNKKIELAVIDTISLNVFWTKLQNNLRTDNRKEVIEVFNYPIHAYYLVLLKFAYDCDIESFNADEEKYANFDIDKTNINDYYDFVFTDYLKDMVYRTSVNDLLERGHRYKNNAGMTYDFFPQRFYDYARENCPYDHLLKFHISFENKKWNIEIGGL